MGDPTRPGWVSSRLLPRQRSGRWRAWQRIGTCPSNGTVIRCFAGFRGALRTPLLASRKPLVGEFTFNGKTVFVIANHFDAKLGDRNGRTLSVPGAVVRGPALWTGADRARLCGQDPRDRQEGRRGRPRRPQRLPVQSGALGSAHRHGGRQRRLDPYRPDHDAPGTTSDTRTTSTASRRSWTTSSSREASAAPSIRSCTSTPNTPIRPATTPQVVRLKP
jgi:hypothetical protein